MLSKMPIVGAVIVRAVDMKEGPVAVGMNAEALPNSVMMKYGVMKKSCPGESPCESAKNQIHSRSFRGHFLLTLMKAPFRCYNPYLLSHPLCPALEGLCRYAIYALPPGT